MSKPVRRGRYSALLLGLIGAAVLTPAPSAQAALPGRDGKAVFTRDGAIRTLEYTGGQFVERRLTAGRGPRWSPDGQRIVYNTATGQVLTMSASGTNKRTVVNHRAYQPAFSPVLPDSTQRIVYVRVPATGGDDLWTVPVSGGVSTRLTTGGASSCGNSQPTWSADGRYIAWVRNNCRKEIVVVLDRTTGKQSQVPTATFPDYGPLVPAPLRISFTPDSTALMYMAQDVQCWEMSGLYSMSTRQVSPYATFSCDGGPHIGEQTTTPSGGVANIYTVPWPDEYSWDGETGRCLHWLPGYTRCLYDYEPASTWYDIDVQPLP